MKVLGFAGSTSSKSINKRLVEHVCETYFSVDEVEIIDLNDYEVAIYSMDREEASGIPDLIMEFATKISAADLIVVSLAEHNASYSAAFKNTYDWISRIKDRKVFDETPLFLMATSPGGRGGMSVLEAAKDRFSRDGADIKSVFSLPSFYTNLPEGAKALTDADLEKKLKASVEAVKEGMHSKEMDI